MKTVILKPSPGSANTLYGSTACPAGAFDTSARLDVQAALIRNVTSPSGAVGKDWSVNHSGTPEKYPQIKDNPEK